MSLPVHVALHYIGAASAVDGGVGVPSRAGAFVEVLADCVRHVTIVAYEPPPSPGFDDGVEYVVRAPNVSFVSLGAKGSWRDHLERRRRVARIVREASPSWDVLLFYFLPNRRARLVYAANRCPKVVSFVVGTVALGALPAGTSAGRRLVSRLGTLWTALQLRGVIRRSGLVVVNSDELRASLPARARTAARVVLLAARHSSQRWRTGDRFQGAGVNLMVAGRMTLEKGVLDAIDAFAIVKKRLHAARLHLAGDGPALDAALERASALGVRDDVIAHGWVPAGDALFSLMREMDVFLMPSYADYEGFPQVIWEAMAHSVLVVCTCVRGPREVLDHERHVLFVPMRDPAAMAEAILRLADDSALRRRLLAEGFDAAEPANVDATVQGILAGVAETWPALAAQQRPDAAPTG